MKYYSIHKFSKLIGRTPQTLRNWDKLGRLSKNFIVLVSEFNAPNNYVSIWSKEKTSILNSKGNYKKDIEHLFTHKDNLKYINREEI